MKLLNFCKKFCGLRNYHQRGKPKPVNLGKRGSMLEKLVEKNKDKKKWHLTFMTKSEKGKSVFEKIHRPNKRIEVLNALFVRNITDILSTSDIAPEVLGYGIEISEVKVTQDYQIVNVYWQIPLSLVSKASEIQNILALRAPQIRAELISRNVLGKVPKIFFVRDIRNDKLLEFEKAMQIIDLGPEDERYVIPDDAFLKNVFSFASSKQSEISEEKINEYEPIKVNEVNSQNPSDMRLNILGLDHDKLMSKICIAKKQTKAVLNETQSLNEENDLFSRIPGSSLQCSIDRGKILKKFCLDRRLMKKEKFNNSTLEYENEMIVSEKRDDNLSQCDSIYEDDYFEEDFDSMKNDKDY